MTFSFPAMSRMSRNSSGQAQVTQLGWTAFRIIARAAAEAVHALDAERARQVHGVDKGLVVVLGDLAASGWIGLPWQEMAEIVSPRCSTFF